MSHRLIVGAGGHSFAKPAIYLSRHPQMNITALAVSAQSVEAEKLISGLQRRLKGVINLLVKPLTLILF
ncbi:hypothetical protein JHU04_001530 [Brenneria sp. 4F2]|nr:hypothetical protein [Brenneria bubanii]